MHFRRRLYSCLTSLGRARRKALVFPLGWKVGSEGLLARGNLPPVGTKSWANRWMEAASRFQAGWLSWEPQVSWMVWGHLDSSIHGQSPCQPHFWE